jgi:hypothetical protein
MRLYLAGPMRGYPEFNHPAFNAAAAALRHAGHEVFNPAENDRVNGIDTAGLKGDLGELASFGTSIRVLLGQDLAWITGTADGVVVLPGWERSLGVRAEVATASAIGIPVWLVEEFLAHGPAAVPVAPPSGEIFPVSG